MLPQEPERVRRWAGWSSLAYGASIIVSGIVTALLGKGFFADFGALVVCVLAAAVLNARGGTKGLTVIMLLYMVVALALLVISLIFPDSMRIGGEPAEGSELLYGGAFAAVGAGWAGINARLLWRLWDLEKAAAE